MRSKKAQKEAAYNLQEISELKDFVGNKVCNDMAMSRQKKLDKMDVTSLEEKPKPEFHFRTLQAASVIPGAMKNRSPDR